MELARQRLNTAPFKSYRCKYREECSHCKKLFEKNQLTKSYCEQCFVCKKKRNADDGGEGEIMYEDGDGQQYEEGEEYYEEYVEDNNDEINGEEGDEQ